MGVSGPTYSMVNQMNEGSPMVVAWPSYVQAPPLDPSAVNGNNGYMMNVIKPDQQQQRVRMDPSPLQGSNTNIGVPSSPNPASVITATYNPTYNRCLPKILSDLDCEMKIKQVLKCIENILLDGSENDQQQSYKLPDRSSSPQLKRIKVKEDEEMHAHSPASGNSAVSKSKSNVRINVKVEPSTESEKAMRNMLGMFQGEGQQGQQMSNNGSPRTTYDPSNRAQTQQQQQQQQQQMQAANPLQKPASSAPRAFSFEHYSYPGSNNNTQFAQQVFNQQHQAQAMLLQQQQQQLATQQQQHLHNVQQLQQQLINNGITVLPQLQQHQISNMQHALQYSLPPHMQMQAQNQPHSPSMHPQYRDHTPQEQQQQQHHQHHQQQAATHAQVPESQSNSNSFPALQMDEFPFPAFSNSILEEVSQYKRDDAKKESTDDLSNPFFFNGLSASAAALQYSQIAQQLQQTSDADQRSLLTSSLSQLQQSLLLQIPHPLSNIPGIEEDDKWILSLLNIDGITHDGNSNALSSQGF